MVVEYSSNDLKNLSGYLLPNNEGTFNTKEAFAIYFSWGILIGATAKFDYDPKKLKEYIYSNEAFDPLSSPLRNTIQKNVKRILYEVKYEDVPLYINDELSSVFVKWRMAIGK